MQMMANGLSMDNEVDDSVACCVQERERERERESGLLKALGNEYKAKCCERQRGKPRETERNRERERKRKRGTKSVTKACYPCTGYPCKAR